MHLVRPKSDLTKIDRARNSDVVVAWRELSARMALRAALLIPQWANILGATVPRCASHWVNLDCEPLGVLKCCPQVDTVA